MNTFAPSDRVIVLSAPYEQWQATQPRSVREEGWGWMREVFTIRSIRNQSAVLKGSNGKTRVVPLCCLAHYPETPSPSPVPVPAVAVVPYAIGDTVTALGVQMEVVGVHQVDGEFEYELKPPKNVFYFHMDKYPHWLLGEFS